MVRRPEFPPEFFRAIDTNGALEAVVIISRTGTQVAAWTKESVHLEALSVMAAMLIGSVDTLIEALGGTSPESISLEAGDQRLLTVKLNGRNALVLIAPRSAGDAYLQSEARRLRIRLASALRRPTGPPPGDDSKSVAIRT